MRTNAKQAELALDAPLDVLLACKSEEQAVNTCLNIALVRHGRDHQAVAMLCGWKSDSCLSEIRNPRNARKMPPRRRERFALATGCNLLAQFIAYQDASANRSGTPTERDVARIAAAACLSAWRIAA
jgi:hypothetical protein